MTKKEEKKLNFEETLAKLNKDYGKNTIVNFKDNSIQKYDIIPTGTISVDYRLLGIGGFAKKKMYMIKGWSGCLAENTYIKSIIVSNKGNIQNSKGGSIKNLYKCFHKRTTLNKDSIFHVISIDENNMVFKNKIQDVIYSGKKECFRITTESGFIIEATNEHKFYNGNIYVALKDIKENDIVYVHKNIQPGLDFRKKRNVYPITTVKYYYGRNPLIIKNKYQYYQVKTHRLIYEAYLNNITYANYVTMLNSIKKLPKNWIKIKKDYHIHHKDENILNNEISNLEMLSVGEYATVHKIPSSKAIKFLTTPDKILEIKSVGIKETYDICCYAPYNNFIAGGIVVHNSNKSTLSAHLTANAQQKGEKVLFIDSEHAVDLQYFEQVGVDISNNFYLSQPSCIWEEEFVLTSEGNKKFKDITETSNLISINNSSYAVKDNYPINIVNSNKEGILLRTSKFNIIASKEHKVKTFNGFKSIEKLEKGKDTIESLYKHNLFNKDNKTELNKNQCFILGAFLGDGNYNGCSPRFCGIDNILNQYLLNLINIEFPETVYTQKDKNISFRKKENKERRKQCTLHIFLNKYLGKVSKQEKFIPLEIFNSGEENLKHFVAGLIMTDGSISKINHTITFSNYIKKVILDFSSILSFFAVPHSINTRTKNTDSGIKTWYNITINTKEGLNFFKKQIPLISYKGDILQMCELENKESFIRFPKDLWVTVFEEIKKEYKTIVKFSNLFFNKKTNQHHFNIKRGLSHEYLIKINSLLKSKKLENIINSDVRYSNILEKTNLNENFNMMDITIPINHNFISNGMVVHNCGETGFETALQLMETGDVGLVIIDSDSMLVPKVMMEAEAGTQTIGKKAKMNSENYPKIKNMALKHNVCVVVICQYRVDPGKMFGDNRVVPGGFAVEYIADVIIELTKTLKKEGDEVAGTITKFKTTKNKTYIPYKEITIETIFGLGFDSLQDILALGKEFGVWKLRAGVVTYKDLKYPEDGFKSLILEDKAFLAEIKQNIIKNIQAGPIETELV